MIISIVGAGPVGCYASYLYSRAGFTVRVYEKRAQLGQRESKLVYVGEKIDEIITLEKDSIVNTIKWLKICGPKENLVVENKGYVIDQGKLEYYLGDTAQKTGVKISLEHEVVSIKKKELTIKNLRHDFEKKAETDIVISSVGDKSIFWSNETNSGGILRKQRSYSIETAIIEHKCDKEVMEYHLGRSGIGIIIPLSEKKAIVQVISINNNHLIEKKKAEENVTIKQATESRTTKKLVKSNHKKSINSQNKTKKKSVDGHKHEENHGLLEDKSSEHPELNAFNNFIKLIGAKKTCIENYEKKYFFLYNKNILVRKENTFNTNLLGIQNPLFPDDITSQFILAQAIYYSSDKRLDVQKESFEWIGRDLMAAGKIFTYLLETDRYDADDLIRLLKTKRCYKIIQKYLKEPQKLRIKLLLSDFRLASLFLPKIAQPF